MASLLTLVILVIPIGIIVGIIFAVKAHKAQDTLTKKKRRRIMWWSFFGPVSALIILIILNGIIRLFANISG